MDNKKKSSSFVTAGILALVVGATSVMSALVSLALPSTYNVFVSIVFLNVVGALFDLAAAGLSIWFGIKLILVADAVNKKTSKEINTYFQIAFWVAIAFGIVSVFSADNMVIMITVLYFVISILILRTQLTLTQGEVIQATGETLQKEDISTKEQGVPVTKTDAKIISSDIDVVSAKIEELAKLKTDDVITEDVYLALKKELLKGVTKKGLPVAKKKVETVAKKPKKKVDIPAQKKRHKDSSYTISELNDYDNWDDEQ